MSILRIFIFGILTLGLFSGVTVFAGGNHGKSATHQMAEIMHRLKHFPSPAGKEVLQEIMQSQSATGSEHTIASAMMNLQHKAASADIPKLKAVIADKKSTSQERELATIVMNLDHRPTKQDKAQLKMMMMH